MTEPPDRPSRGYVSEKPRYLNRLKRIEGQVRGIARMVDDDQYCIDVLTQVSAANAALRGLALALLDDHLKHCLTDAAQSGGGSDPDHKVREASAAINRLLRS